MRAGPTAGPWRTPGARRAARPLASRRSIGTRAAAACIGAVAPAVPDTSDAEREFLRAVREARGQGIAWNWMLARIEEAAYGEERKLDSGSDQEQGRPAPEPRDPGRTEDPGQAHRQGSE